MKSRIVYNNIDKEKIKESRRSSSTEINEKEIIGLLEKFQTEEFGIEKVIDILDYGKNSNSRYHHVNQKEIASGEARIIDNNNEEKDLSFSIYSGRSDTGYVYDQLEIVLED
jgi:hypothetical protein